ncbi:MAG: hypothetical protein GTO55_06500 [Armatimonadetes bacterium]|nr:hypothetical protein [Armatimonadota bacterium]NIM23933.1 hypothetical protein [Armatimonadota bacterium]NIM67780.1 hypothetical protein [Armatimonadota bacterium]NIM76320.1 hypothetical protein [Armatimonadota bacterium]NIN06014.1 hypothetical protein [Armatimonadota bacterium]
MRRVFELACIVLVVLLAGCGVARRALAKMTRPAFPEPVEEALEYLEADADLEELSDWDITYRVSKYEDEWNEEPVPPHRIRARYKAPHHLLVEREGYAPFRALADEESTKIYFPDYRLMLWVLPDSAPYVALDNISLSGEEDSLYWSRLDNVVFLRRARRGKEDYKLLADEVVAGRKCSVVQVKWQDEEDWYGWSGEEIVTTRWIDKQYDVTMAIRSVVDGEVIGEGRVEEVHINEGIDKGIFCLEVPDGTLSYKGPFYVDAARSIAEYVKSGFKQPDPYLAAFPELRQPVQLLRPRYLPPGFAAFCRYAEGDDEAWYVTSLFINTSGGTIELNQETQNSRERPELGKSRAFEPATIRDLPAHSWHYRKPYEGVILAWEENGMKLWLEGTDVPETELCKMAEGMEWATLDPECGIVVIDMAEAERLLGEKILAPSYLPARSALSRIMVYPGYSVTLEYSQASAGSIELVQYADTEGFESEMKPYGAQATTVGPYRAWHSSTTGPPCIVWVQGDTLLILSAKMPKKELFKIAESLKPAVTQTTK